HFHLWKDDGIDYKHFGEGGIKQWFDLAHEKLRTVNGPPTLQFADLNFRGYETLRSHPSEYLRFQAEQSRQLAAGAMPLVRAIGKNAPSPAVKARVRELESMADRLIEPPTLALRAVGKVVELVAARQAQAHDRLERPPVVSDPGARWSYYNQGSAAPKRRGAFGPADKQSRAAGGLSTSWPFARKRVEPPVDPGRVRVEHEDDDLRVEGERARKRLAVVR
ncbi:MAG: hypothetical protein IT377_04090, partial [Polyangiaceae bacterium]|nr:hypothetical protein [Polyangiaceae bacterium]